MDKVILSENDLLYLLKWRDEHKDLVRRNPSPMKSIEIICKDSGFTIKGIREDDSLRLHINHKGLSLGNVQFELRPDGMWNKVKDRTNLPDKDGVQSALTVYGSLMALMVYGQATSLNSEEITKLSKPEVKKSLKNKGSNKPNNKARTKSIIYILRNDKDGLSVVSRGFHASPKGIFSVRGHYRRYKSGKIVWISEFQKGTGKKKNKTYKVGVKENHYDFESNVR